jgi:hypothetical protein
VQLLGWGTGPHTPVEKAIRTEMADLRASDECNEIMVYYATSTQELDR